MTTSLAIAFEQDPATRLRALMNMALDEAVVGAPFNPPPCDQKKLKECAMEAIIKSPKNWDGAKDIFFKAVRRDPDLLWALIEPYRLAAAQRILSEVSTERYHAEKASKFQVVQPRQVFERPKPAPVADVAKAAAKVASLTVLDTFKINGKPIGDLTAKEANKWAGSRERDARFVRLLTANLPPEEPIRKFRTGDDAQTLYNQAEEEQD